MLRVAGTLPLYICKRQSENENAVMPIIHWNGIPRPC